MTRILDKPLVLVTGKGGVGKSTVAAALGRATCSRGLRTMVCEVGEAARMPELLGGAPGEHGVEHQADDGLWTVSIDPDEALKAWAGQAAGLARAGQHPHPLAAVLLLRGGCSGGTGARDGDEDLGAGAA